MAVRLPASMNNDHEADEELPAPIATAFACAALSRDHICSADRGHIRTVSLNVVDAGAKSVLKVQLVEAWSRVL